MITILGFGGIGKNEWGDTASVYGYRLVVVMPRRGAERVAKKGRMIERRNDADDGLEREEREGNDEEGKGGHKRT